MYLFIDDSGDAGFKFDKGSSRHLVMAACVIPTAQALSEVYEAIERAKKRVNKVSEFKHAKTKSAHKEIFFEELRETDYFVRVIYVDKTQLWSERLRKNPDELKSYLIGQLLTHSGEHVKDATVVIDGADLRAFGRKSTTYIYEKCQQEAPGTVVSVKCADSKDELGLQLADMVAGTIMYGLKDRRGSRQSDRWREVWKRSNGPRGTRWNFK